MFKFKRTTHCGKDSHLASNRFGNSCHKSAENLQTWEEFSYNSHTQSALNVSPLRGGEEREGKLAVLIRSADIHSDGDEVTTALL